MVRITKTDWDRVHELACEIVNASSADDSILVAAKTESLMIVLSELEKKYGRCSQIIATVADFTDDKLEQSSLYREALQKARDEGDAENERLIQESIDEASGRKNA